MEREKRQPGGGPIVDGAEGRFGFICSEVSESMMGGIEVTLEPPNEITPYPKWNNTIHLTQMPHDHGFEVGKTYMLAINAVPVEP